MKREILLSDVKEAPILYTCAKDENIAPGTRFGPVILEQYIIECCTEGAGSVIINDVEIPFKAGDCYIVQPGQKIIYTADPVTSRRGVWCALDGIAVSKTVAELGISANEPFISPELFEPVVAEITVMIEAKEHLDMGAPLRRTGAIYTLLGILLQNKPERNKNASVEKAIGFIETNYYRSISVEDIANDVGFERCYFSTLFKQRTGISPHAYLSQVRIRKAGVLINEKGYSVSEASEMVGLDPQNFARLFRKITGKNPKDFRK